MWWRGIKIAMAIVGTTIGAGFASGREIWEFFGSYGTVSHWGILLSMLLFSLSSMVILTISWSKGTRNYYEVLVSLMGKGLARWFDKLVFLYLLSSVTVMFAGSGATFKQWNLPFWLGVLGVGAAVLLILIYGVKGLLSLNVVLMPVLTVILMYVCLSYIFDVPSSAGYALEGPNLGISEQWPSAITYASLNIVPLLAVLSTLGGEIKDRREIWVGGIISALFLGGVAFLLNKALMKVGPEEIALFDIPLFSMIVGHHSYIILLVTVVLWLAIYTTAVSGVYGISYRLSQQWRTPIWLIGCGVMIVLSPLTQFGFSTLVNILYPIYGILNLFILAMIILYPIQSARE
jgi:uncharacterized membrane protein YkvI